MPATVATDTVLHRAIIGECDSCARGPRVLHRTTAYGIDTAACAKCQGGTDEDVAAELQEAVWQRVQDLLAAAVPDDITRTAILFAVVEYGQATHGKAIAAWGASIDKHFTPVSPAAKAVLSDADILGARQ